MNPLGENSRNDKSTEINKVENNQIEKINKTKNWFFERLKNF